MPEILLSPVVDSIDSVPESHRDLYEERDGKHVLAKPIKIDDPSEIKSALASERKLRQELAGKVGQLPDDVKAKLAKAEEIERKEMERQGQYQELIKTAEQKAQTEIQKYQARADKLSTTLTRTLESNAATNAINAAGGIVKGLLPHVLPELKAVENPDREGEFTVYVINPSDPSKPRTNLKTGEPLTVEELIAEKREDDVLSKLFAASAASGSGGGGSSFTKGSPRIVKLSADEAKDTKRYQQLKEQKAKGEIDGAIDDKGRRIV
jgi:hypothetical protein